MSANEPDGLRALTTDEIAALYGERLMQTPKEQMEAITAAQFRLLKGVGPVEYDKLMGVSYTGLGFLSGLL